MASDADALARLGIGVDQLLSSVTVPMLVTDVDRRALWCNDSYCELFGVEGGPSELIGQDMSEKVRWAADQFEDPEAFLAGVDEALRHGVTLRGGTYRRRDGRLFLRAYAPVVIDGSRVANLWRYEDVTEFDRRRQSMERTTRVLEAMVHAHGPAVRRSSGSEVFSALLDGLIDVTDSAYGFVGEVLLDDDARPYLRSWAITDIAWDDATRTFYESAMRDNGYLEFRNLQTLFGETLRTAEVVIANDPEHDPRAGGLPPGHPPLVSYLGLPIVRGEQMVGMAGLAGRVGGYSTEIVAELEPLLHACGSMIEAYALDRELREVESALRSALDQAERANEAKTRLLGRVSHELRTPLNAVLGFAQLLEREVADPKAQRWVSQIRTAGEHVLAQVDDLLDLAAAESGRLAVALESVAVDPLVGAVVDMVAPLAKERSVTVRCNPSGAAVMADPSKLRVVLLNLVSNAIKYNHTGGSVEVSVVGLDGSTAIEVADDGPGIPDGEIEKAFVMFERLDDTGRNIPGAGLGLAIAREYAMAMGGELRGRHRDGGGVVMSVVLPVAEGTGGGAGGESLPVLYVEDNDLNAELVREYLSAAEGLTVEVAPTLAAGRAWLAERSPSVLLLDLNLPDGSGADLARELIQQGSTVPVVLLTADAFAAKDLASELPTLAGALVKPFDFAELSALVARHARRAP